MLVLGLAFVSFAAYKQSITVEFDSIKIKVNGTSISKPNILYNGTTYVPLRAISEILGKDVIWDAKTFTANINDKEYDPSESRIGYSRLNPAGLNETIKFIFENGYESGTLTPKKYTANITVKDIIRGDQAITMIKAANQFNDEPSSGYDYILMKIKFELLDAPDQYDLNGYSFKLVSNKGKDYESVSVVQPEPKLQCNLYKGASNEGYATFKVETTDDKPVLTFGRDYNGNGGAWFKAYK
jgi:hypothetical protein